MPSDFLIIAKETTSAKTQQPPSSGTPRHYSPMPISRIHVLGRLPASLTSSRLKKKTHLEINTVLMQTSAAIILHGMMRLGEMIGCFSLEGARDLMNLNSKAWGELVWLRRWDATQWYNLINYTFLLLVLLKPMKARLYQVFLRDRNSSAGQGTHARGLRNQKVNFAILNIIWPCRIH